MRAADRVIRETSAAFNALRVFSDSESRPIARVVIGFGLFGVAPILCFVAALLDDTLTLRAVNGGRGLLEHWGTLVQFVALPVILLLTHQMVKRLAEAIEEFTDDGTDESRRFIDQAVDILACKRPPFQVILGLLMLIGLFSLVVNAQNTRNAIEIYGQDVWDSSTHLWGYMAGRLFLGLEWIYVFPVVVYVGAATFVVVTLLTRHTLNLQPALLSPFAPDGCGGFRILGQVMLAFVYLDIPFACIVVAHIMTHDRFYLTLGLAGSLFIAALCAQLFLPFLDLHRFVSRQKKLALIQLSEKIERTHERLLRPGKQDSGIPLTILALLASYRETKRLNTWPYLGTDVVKWFSPLLPIVTAVLTKGILHVLKVPT